MRDKKIKLKKDAAVLTIIIVFLVAVSFFVPEHKKKDGVTLANQVLNARVPNFASNQDEMVALNNGEVDGVYKSDGIGRWSITLNKDLIVSGDYNNDGVSDIATVLIASGGGSGVFYYLVLFANENGSPKYITSQYLGDRIKVNKVIYKDKFLSVDMITQGPDEGYCCGTLHKVLNYEIANDVLVEKDGYQLDPEQIIALKILADEPKSVKSTGVIIGLLTYARYVVLGDDDKATLRGWIVEGPESKGTQPGANEVPTYPHKYNIGQRIAFSGELTAELSWCGKFAQDYILETKVNTSPITDQQCFGWVHADTVELAPAK